MTVVSLNIFRTSGDFLHLLAMLILLYRIRFLKTCAGISLKTQELYALVYITRYLDIFWNFLSLYNTVFKIVFLVTSFATVYFIRFKFKHTYDKTHDTFRVVFLIAPCAVLSLLIHNDWAPSELLWTFSIYLEAVAILPQLFLVQRTGEVETMNSHYIAALGGYRVLYLINWIYRYFTEPNYSAWIVWIAGAIQSILYADFFYYYIISRARGQKLSLPS